MFKKIIVSIIILLLFFSNVFAYTLEVKTWQEIKIYEDVVNHRLEEDFLVIQILGGFDNYKVYVKKNFILEIKIIR